MYAHVYVPAINSFLTFRKLKETAIFKTVKCLQEISIVLLELSHLVTFRRSKEEFVHIDPPPHNITPRVGVAEIQSG